MENFKQKLKYGTHTITFLEAENPKEDMLCHKWSNDKSLGATNIIKGNDGIKRFRDWLNKLNLL